MPSTNVGGAQQRSMHSLVSVDDYIEENQSRSELTGAYTWFTNSRAKPIRNTTNFYSKYKLRTAIQHAWATAVETD